MIRCIECKFFRKKDDRYVCIHQFANGEIPNNHGRTIIRKKPNKEHPRWCPRN